MTPGRLHVILGRRHMTVGRLHLYPGRHHLDTSRLRRRGRRPAQKSPTMDKVQLYARVKKTVVQVNITIGEEICVCVGIVLCVRDSDIIILVHDHGIDLSACLVEVTFPNQAAVVGAFVIVSGAKIALLSCPNIIPDQQNSVEEAKMFDGDLQDLQEVHTYSHHQKYCVLTPGNIMSFFDGGFNHNCSANKVTRYGSPVFNKDAQLVGFCSGFQEYVSAYNISETARRIDLNFGRGYKIMFLLLK